jgi:hypothetical protein
VAESGRMELRTASDTLVGNVVENIGGDQYSFIRYRLPLLSYVRGWCSE